MGKYEVRLFETATWVAYGVEADSEDEAIEIATEQYNDGDLRCTESSIEEQIPYVLKIA